MRQLFAPPSLSALDRRHDDRRHGRRPRPLTALTLAALLVAAGCSGARPELVTAEEAAADSETPSTEETVEPSTDEAMADDQPSDEPGPALQVADCVTAAGAGPWPVAIEASNPPTVACVHLANHHRIEFVNNTPDPVSFELAGLAVDIEPAASFVTEPAGAFLQPGLTELAATPHPVSGLWASGPEINTMAGQAIGLSTIGAISVGATPVEISAAVGGAAVAAADQACYVTTLAGDPYSPLFTITDGSLSVMQVFTPGQLTRSEIGVGSAEGDVTAAYGERIETQPSPDGDANKKLLVFVPVDAADQQYRLVFVVDSGVVTSIRNGLTDVTLGNPACG